MLSVFQLGALFILWGCSCVAGVEVRAITSSCPTLPSLTAYLEKRNESENIGIEEIVNQAAALVPAVDTTSMSVPTVEAAYNATLVIFAKEDNPENAAHFYEALGEITKTVYSSCFGEMPITLANFPSVKNELEQAYSDQEIHRLREAYGQLLCLKRLAETEETSRKRRSTPMEIETFYKNINVTVLASVFYPQTEPYSVAFVIDDTGSMGREIENVKCLVRAFLKSGGKDPKKYILGTFNDPGMCMMIA